MTGKPRGRRKSFNGTAPLMARKYLSTRKTTHHENQLQWDRAFDGAEMSLERIKSRPASCFNGTAPLMARKSQLVPLTFRALF